MCVVSAHSVIHVERFWNASRGMNLIYKKWIISTTQDKQFWVHNTRKKRGQSNQTQKYNP